MSDPKPPEAEEPQVAEVVTGERSRLSAVWIVPLVAIAIAGWLVWTTLAEKGPQITIRFRSAEGLEPGKSVVRYKAVEVGKVTSIQIAADLSHVLVHAELTRGAERLLAEDSRFWVVRPRIGAGGVSGLSTLLSGAYIEVDPGKGPPATEFEGLEEPPVVLSDEPGRQFVLVADALEGITRGSPLYYRDIEVGEVLGYKLAEDGRSVEIVTFVRAPFDRLVRADSRFWNTSGFEIGTGAGGFYFRMQSVQAMLTGGIAFGEGKGEAAEEGSRFPLYASYRAMRDSQLDDAREYLVYFDGSLRGLKPGAPVEFRGIEVGRVTDVRLVIDYETGDVRIPVRIAMLPERLAPLAVSGGEARPPADFAEKLIARGVRAQLKTANLLTGELVVDLDIHPDAPPAELRTENGVPVIPSVPSDLETITSSMAELLDKLSSLPLAELIADLRTAIRDVDRLMNDPRLGRVLAALERAATRIAAVAGALEGEVGPTAVALRRAAEKADRAVLEATRLFRQARDTLDPNSRLYQSVVQMTQETARAARAVRLLAEYLERNPQALIRGRGQ